jgi:hypothetical protein
MLHLHHKSELIYLMKYNYVLPAGWLLDTYFFQHNQPLVIEQHDL